MKRLSSSPAARFLFTLPAVFLLLVAAGCDGGGTGGETVLSSGVREVVESPEFANSSWGIRVADLGSGEELESLDSGAMLDPASTTKLFTAAAALDVLGEDYTFETPVYRRGGMGLGGALEGDLVLVAGGDLVLGGRGAIDGTIEYTDADHADANALGYAELTGGDPLAGLDELARQVAAGGIREIKGDVIVDDRLYGPGSSFNPSEEYILTPIMVNENLIDLVITPGSPGGPAEVEWRPRPSVYQVENRVVTITAGERTELVIEESSPGVITVEGLIPADAGETVRTFQVTDPASFARTLFIEALRRAGVTVAAPETGTNNVAALPAPGSYAEPDRVALLVSPPLKEYARLILKVSHNLGADTLLYLMAVDRGGSTMEEGLALEKAFLDRAGVDTGGIILNDGQGAFGANFVSPDSVVQLLRYMSTRGDFATYRDCLPVLGVDGSLAGVLTSSPAAGKVQAKTGTHAGGDALNQRMVVQARALGGYMVTASGRELVFDINVNHVPIDDMDGLLEMMQKHAGIVEAVYNEY